MLAFDTNIAVYAANTSDSRHASAREFLQSLSNRNDVVICDLMLVELFLKLCNPRIFPAPWTPPEAADHCMRYRENRVWKLVENAMVMDEVWRLAAASGFAFRRIIDARLALTLLRNGVTEFATHNLRDFDTLGFDRVWNPLADG
ncbi:MAG: TA system VapC family ribonuclease toxin [Chthoniobacterales bacterium]